MGKETSIAWTSATCNFWVGCIKVSKACKFCYMYRDRERYGHDPKIVVRTKPNTFNAPLKWKEPMLIFTNSWSDFFIAEADNWREDAWNVIRATPQHQWQILTKRPERIKECLPDDWGSGYPNVWLGASVEDQENAELRIPILIDIPAKIRFLSVEPLLDKVDLSKWLTNSKLSWIITGGESGNGSVPNEKGVKYGYRECKIEWIKEVVSQCKANNIAVFVKQLGTHLSKTYQLRDRTGSDMEEWKAIEPMIMVREFPKYETKK